MSIQEIQDYCQSLPNTEKAMPCGENLLVFHMEGNIYLYVWLKAPISSITVKLQPERGKELRERYNAISPAYHICEKHWNDIFIDGTFPNNMIEEWIKESYDLVKTESRHFVQNEVLSRSKQGLTY